MHKIFGHRMKYKYNMFIYREKRKLISQPFGFFIVFILNFFGVCHLWFSNPEFESDFVVHPD